MKRTNSQSMVESVRLFPRLVAFNEGNGSAGPQRPSKLARSVVVVKKEPRETAREEVRARLFRMIVENERNRRNEKRSS
jgi:hypothetical protein